jgi:hypothetical protein
MAYAVVEKKRFGLERAYHSTSSYQPSGMKSYML